MSEAKRSWRDLLGRVVFWFVVAFVIFAGAMTLIVNFMRRDESKMDMSNVVSAAPMPKPDRLEASAATGACMLFIKKVLHDPDSAQFEHSRDASVIISGDRAIVVRGVRAKNGLGALRREDFWCFLEYRGGKVFPVLIAENNRRSKEILDLKRKWGFAQN